MLEVRLIGTFDIKCDGKPVIISSRIAQSLFAYLVLNAGKSHRREKLAGMFWPDTAEEKARAYLRHELWRIRKALSTKSKVEYLISDDINLSFNSSADYWLDANLLKELSKSASVDELVKSLSIFQGELLPGFYDEWIVLEREYLQTVFEQNVSQLLELLESEKRWSNILDWAENWISFGQGPEAAYRYLMIAYEALGDPVRLTSTYERCRKALRALDLEPSEQTRALAYKRNSKINIPIPLTSFIGREEELKEVANLLSKSRLVTLTGSGGVGKTRLAIQVVADVLEGFPDGVWFLDLAPLNNSALVASTLMTLLGLRESVGLPANDLLVNYFRSRTALVIFDNCEHLIDSCSQLINSLLGSCEKLSILATSRETLRVSGEITYRVPSLEIPTFNMEPSVDTFSKIESAKLFIERAALASPHFAINSHDVALIAQIVHRLDGIPLAIELAAARVNVLTAEQILKRLDDRFNLLTSGLRSTLPRHQTLRATIEWSYNLLSQKEQLLYRRLAVFMGGWTLEAAEHVCTGHGIEASAVLELLTQLVNKSLVLVETSEPEKRYRSLETIRQFAREQLGRSDEEESTRTQHLKYFLQFSEQAELALKGHAQNTWYARLIDERDNIRAALDWANKTDIRAGLLISGRLWQFWEDMDLLEGEGWLKRFLENQESYIQPYARAKALYAYGMILSHTQPSALMGEVAEECLEIYRTLGNKHGEIDGLIVLSNFKEATRGDTVEDIECLQQALALSKSLGDTWRNAFVLTGLGWCSDKYEQRISHFKEAISLFRKTGDLRKVQQLLGTLGNIEILEGDIESAQEHVNEAMLLNQNLYNRAAMRFIPVLSSLEALKGNFEKARVLLEKDIEHAIELGNRGFYLWNRAKLGHLIVQQGDHDDEAHEIFLETTREFLKDRNDIGVCYSLERMAGLYASADLPVIAARLIGWADLTRKKFRDPRPRLEQADIDKITTACIAKIGEVAFSHEHQDGGKMTLEEVVNYGLKISR